MRIAGAGQAVFAATMIALGIMGLVDRDFTVIWQPIAKGVPARELWMYLSALISLACGVALFWRRSAATAARVLLAFLVLWVMVFRLPGLFRSLAVDMYWAASKTAVMVAAALALSATGNRGVRIAQTLYGIAIIPFGIAHFQFVANTASLVPGWLPGHVVWAYVTGGAFVVAGIAMLIGVYARLAAALSAIQMGVFLLLVWVPVAAAVTLNAFQRGEVIVTWTLAAAGWVVADSYRAVPNAVKET